MGRVVCLGMVGLDQPDYLARLGKVGAEVEPVALPIDPGGNPFALAPNEPHPEPPPWGTETAAQRREVLSRLEAIVCLHVPQDIMTLAPNLKWIHSVGAGVEQFVKAGVKAGQVKLTNSSGIGARSISEFVIGRLLYVWKRFDEIDALQKKKEWFSAYGRTFGGSTLGIIGLGAIGVAVAERARAFDVRVLGMKGSYRPGMTSPHCDELCGPDDLHSMLGQCDAVVLAAPETPQTVGMMDAAAFAAMKPGSVFVNVARGALVQEPALIDAIRSDHLGAAVLDVFEPEPLAPDSLLWDLPRTYISSHCSAATDRYIEDLYGLFEENLRLYLTGEPMRNEVDMVGLGFAAD